MFLGDREKLTTSTQEALGTIIWQMEMEIEMDDADKEDRDTKIKKKK